MWYMNKFMFAVCHKCDSESFYYQDTTTGFLMKWHLRNNHNNFILMMCNHSDLGKLLLIGRAMKMSSIGTHREAQYSMFQRTPVPLILLRHSVGQIYDLKMHNILHYELKNCVSYTCISYFWKGKFARQGSGEVEDITISRRSLPGNADENQLLKTKRVITAALIAPQYVPPALNDNDDDVCDDDDDDDKLTIITQWLKVLPWKGSRSWCQQKIPCRTVAMLSIAVFLACLDK